MADLSGPVGMNAQPIPPAADRLQAMITLDLVVVTSRILRVVLGVSVLHGVLVNAEADGSKPPAWIAVLSDLASADDIPDLLALAEAIDHEPATWQQAAAFLLEFNCVLAACACVAFGPAAIDRIIERHLQALHREAAGSAPSPDESPPSTQ